MLDAHHAPVLTVPKILPEGAVVLSPGSRGKKLGEARFSAQHLNGDWTIAGEEEQLKGSLERYVKRVENVSSKLESKEDKTSTEFRRLQRQREHYSEQVQQVQQELVILSERPQGRVLNNRLIDLSGAVAAHPQVEAVPIALPRDAAMERGPCGGGADLL